MEEQFYKKDYLKCHASALLYIKELRTRNAELIKEIESLENKIMEIEMGEDL